MSVIQVRVKRRKGSFELRVSTPKGYELPEELTAMPHKKFDSRLSEVYLFEMSYEALTGLPEILKLPETESVNVLGPIISFVKRPHVGHLFGIVQAYVTAKSLNGKHVIINNDQCPAVGSIIEHLSEHMPVATAISTLKRMPPASIEKIYHVSHQRVPNESTMRIVKSEKDLLKNVVEETEEALRMIGFPSEIINESDIVTEESICQLRNLGLRVSSEEWKNYGVSYLHSRKVIVPLIEKGIGTAYLLALLGNLAVREGKRTLVVFSDEYPDKVVKDSLEDLGYKTILVSSPRVTEEGQKCSGRKGTGTRIVSIAKKFSGDFTPEEIRKGLLSIVRSSPPESIPLIEKELERVLSSVVPEIDDYLSKVETYPGRDGNLLTLCVNTLFAGEEDVYRRLRKRKLLFPEAFFDLVEYKNIPDDLYPLVERSISKCKRKMGW